MEKAADLIGAGRFTAVCSPRMFIDGGDPLREVDLTAFATTPPDRCSDERTTKRLSGDVIGRQDRRRDDLSRLQESRARAVEEPVPASAAHAFRR